MKELRVNITFFWSIERHLSKKKKKERHLSIYKHKKRWKTKLGKEYQNKPKKKETESRTHSSKGGWRKQKWSCVKTVRHSSRYELSYKIEKM